MVLDPACSEASLLMAVADRSPCLALGLAGQEIDEEAAATAAANLRADTHDLPYEIHVGDSLLGRPARRVPGKAAAVVCEPPFDLAGWPETELTRTPAGSSVSRLRATESLPGYSTATRTCDRAASRSSRCPGGLAWQPSGERIRTALVRRGSSGR